MSSETVKSSSSWLAAVVMLFGLLMLATHGNELLKQAVLAPGSSADLGIDAECRADELEEEQLSLEECQLMVSSVRIFLSSSPSWFRAYQLTLSSLGAAAALFSMAAAFAVSNGQRKTLRLAAVSIALLLLIDVAGFVAAINSGPLLRAQYLWPLLTWIAIHVCMLVAVIRIGQQSERES